MGVSNNIKELRKSIHMTQKELAQETGLSIGTIQGYEHGKYEPKLNALTLLKNVLGCSYDDILDEPLFDTNEVNIVEPKTNELREEVAALRYSLNDDGLAKTRDYMRDLMGNPKYKIGN